MTGDEATLMTLESVSERVAALLAAAGIDARDIRDRRVSRADLVAAGVPEGDADSIRRSHRLAWSFRSGEGDLVRRAARVRGLSAAERAWVAAADGDWEGAAAVAAGRSETALTGITGVSETDADRLAAAGVTTVEALATVDAADLADVLGVDVRHLRTWRRLARER